MTHPMNAAADTDDSTLLAAHAHQGDEGAFAELVRRRIGLVYSVALRQCRGDLCEVGRGVPAEP